MAELHRTVSLDFTTRKWMHCQAGFFMWRATICAPLLKRLRVDGPEDACYGLLPLRLLMGGAPMLESLDLFCSNQYWGWKSIRLPCLKHLSVRASLCSKSGQAVQVDSLSSLLCALLHSPCLEELTLVDSIPPRTEALDHKDIVCLPRLRRIKLKAAAICIKHLLASLSFPDNTRQAFFLDSLALNTIVAEQSSREY
jgi:hypothetical protein